MKINPYIAGNPVGGQKAFIGRRDVLKEVFRLAKNPKENALVLFGQRRIGKTSILKELIVRLPQEGSFSPVYFDLQDKAALPLNLVVKELAGYITRDLHLPPFNDFKENIPEKFKKTFIPHILGNLVKDSILFLLFDEFDVLDNPQEGQAVNNFFPYLRELLSLNTKRIKFIFVIGRRTEDLTSLTLSVFKGVKSKYVSLLSKEDTFALAKLSLENNSLHWTEDALEELFDKTGGHPYITQQLCQDIWEELYEDDPTGVPQVTKEVIHTVLPRTLQSVNNAMEWLWDGLKPAERIIASILAEAGDKTMTQGEIENQLQEKGARIMMGELKNAPKVLCEWDLIEPIGKEGYKFKVEFLRLWINEKKPVSRVLDEMDKILPVADNLFQAANGLYKSGDFEQAKQILKQAISVNPNHLKAHQLLSEIYIINNELINAKKLLTKLMEYNPQAARPRLVQVLLRQAEECHNENEALVLYEKILELEPHQQEALDKVKEINGFLAEKALETKQYDKAYELFQKAGIEDKIKQVKNLLFDRDLKIVEELVSKKKFEKAYIMIEDLFKIHPDNKQLREIRNKINTPVFNERLKTIQKLKKQYDFQTALEFAEYLHKEFPSYENLPDLEEIKVGLFCEEKYQEAMKYSKKKETRENAVTSLLSLLEKKSDYKDAAFQLHINIRRKKDEIEKKRGWIVSFILISIIMIIISINLVFIKNNNNSEYSFYTNTVIPDLLIMIINSIIFSFSLTFLIYKQSIIGIRYIIFFFFLISLCISTFISSVMVSSQKLYGSDYWSYIFQIIFFIVSIAFIMIVLVLTIYYLIKFINKFKYHK